MTLSPYFEELHSAYRAEIDDLATDSEGKNVLAHRLQEKRSQFTQLMPMIAFAPEMVAPAFHGGVRFEEPKTLLLLASAEPEDFPGWDEIKECVSFAPWADALLPIVLAEAGGEQFLLTTVCLEFLLARENERGNVQRATVASSEDEQQEDGRDLDHGSLDDDEGLDGSGERRDGDRDDGDEEPDLDQAGADWMSEQGFDRRG